MSDSGIIFREIKGNLFTSPSDFALAHCVTVNLSMGAGIAREFRYMISIVVHL